MFLQVFLSNWCINQDVSAFEVDDRLDESGSICMVETKKSDIFPSLNYVALVLWVLNRTYIEKRVQPKYGKSI